MENVQQIAFHVSYLQKYKEITLKLKTLKLKTFHLKFCEGSKKIICKGTLFFDMLLVLDILLG